MADEVIPIRPRRGGLIHATALSPKRLNVTLCGRACSGWTVDEGPLTCPRCQQLAAKGKPARQDPSGHWRTKIGKLADALGWRRDEMWGHWSQLAMQVEYEGRIARTLAEMTAFRVLEAAVTKQEGEPS